MDIDEYLWRNKISQKKFSKKAGIAAHTLSILVHRHVSPKLVTAIKIIEASDNIITIEDLLRNSDREELKEYRENQKNL